MQIESITLSGQGGREYNEDVFGQWQDARFVAALVADGAGGHGGGDVAAAITRASVLDNFAQAPTLARGAIAALLEQANLDVVARQAEGGKLAAMRSTVVFAAIDLAQRALIWAHSGDSRAYLIRGGAIVARSTDHSLVQQMVASGLIDEEAARRHPRRNLLLSALGSIEEPPEIAVSDRLPVAPGDVLLLCSDGIWEPLGDQCLLDTLHAARGNAADWSALLEAQVRARARAGHDNYTAVMLWMRDEDAQNDSDDDAASPSAVDRSPISSKTGR